MKRKKQRKVREERTKEREQEKKIKGRVGKRKK